MRCQQVDARWEAAESTQACCAGMIGTQESAFEPQTVDPAAYGYLSSFLGTCDD